MSVNKYKPHVLVIPEDDANRQLAIGFRLHHTVNARSVKIMTPAGGWHSVLEVFEEEYIPYLNAYSTAHVVLVVDFDDNEHRWEQCQQRIPESVRSRVFVIGSRDEPETIRRDLQISLEQIGLLLAGDCHKDDFGLWRTPHFEHNSSELERLVAAVKPIVFQSQ
jgi:hypothetical protein